MIDEFQRMFVDVAAFVISILCATAFALCYRAMPNAHGRKLWTIFVCVAILSIAMQMLAIQYFVEGSEIGLGQLRGMVLIKGQTALVVALAWLKRSERRVGHLSLSRASGIGVISAPIGFILGTAVIYTLGILLIAGCLTSLLACRT